MKKFYFKPNEHKEIIKEYILSRSDSRKQHYLLQLNEVLESKKRTFIYHRNSEDNQIIIPAKEYTILKEGILAYINFADINFLESYYKGKLIVEGRIFGTDFDFEIELSEYNKIKVMLELLKEVKQ